MLTDAFQSALPQTNWMYPAVTPAAACRTGLMPSAPRNRC
jgi:ABC-type thiamine transport system substrate-binding protein